MSALGMFTHLTEEPGVYVIANETTHRVYVGSTNNLKRRISSHFYALRTGTHGNCHLQRAFNKYGEADFSFAVAQYVADVSDLVECEQLVIYALDACNRNVGFNIIPRADRRSMSDETRRKISESGKTAQLGKIVSPETRRRIAESLMGRKLSPETIEKRSAKRRGVPLTPEHRAAISAANLGAKRSDDARENMRKAQLGKKRTPESIAKSSASMRATLARKREARAAHQSSGEEHGKL